MQDEQVMAYLTDETIRCALTYERDNGRHSDIRIATASQSAVEYLLASRVHAKALAKGFLVGVPVETFLKRFK
tara:strand:- start:202 stop:420 length:219 start_codon:yes stop_codon:yes gene_type:complete